MTIEERSHWLNRLLALSDRRGRDIPIWKAEIQTALRGTPIFAELLKQMEGLAVQTKTRQRRNGEPSNTDKYTRELQEIEFNIYEIVDAAIRTVANTPVSLDDTLRIQITQLAHDAVLTSPLARIVRWGIPLVVVLIFGGTGYGLWKFEGTVKLTENAAVQAEKKISDKSNEINGYIKEKKDGIDSVVTAATAAINTAKKGIEDKSASDQPKIDQSVTNASKSLEKTVAAEKQAGVLVENIKEKEQSINLNVLKIDGLTSKINNLKVASDNIEKQLSDNRNIVEARWRFNNVLGMVPETLRDAVLTTTFWTTWLFNGITLLALGLSIWALRRRHPSRLQSRSGSGLGERTIDAAD